jgi:hypothetical protein
MSKMDVVATSTKENKILVAIQKAISSSLRALPQATHGLPAGQAGNLAFPF